MAAEKLILTFDNSYKEELLKTLSTMRFIVIERKEDILEKFICHAPQNVHLNDDDIMDEIKSVVIQNDGCFYKFFSLFILTINIKNRLSFIKNCS